jgi:CDP-glycerol glycerophosphotransferase
VDDIQEVLIHSDILITDYSSVCFDFALTGRPIIYYPYDFGDYLQYSRKFYIDYFTEMPGPFAKNARELLDLIVNWNNWFEDYDYQVKYQKFIQRFQTYKDGNSCDRL